MPDSGDTPTLLQDLTVEVDAEGRSAGVEREDLSSDEVVHDPFDPRKIDVTTEARTLDSILKRLELGQIDLDPDFQRSRGIWSARKKTLLIESLLLRIPLPTFYVAEIEDDGALGEDKWAVVDGIQRLSTIAEFVAPQIFGQEPFRLSGLEYLDSEELKTFADLPQSLRLRILESQFTFQVIRKSTPEQVQLNIFARINTGGVPLSTQELRHALTPGPARHLLRDLASSPQFREAVDESVSPSRMADREMVLRFLAFRMTDPLAHSAQDFDAFLRDTMRAINQWTEDETSLASNEFRHTMTVCHKIFGNDAFRKRYSTDDPRRPVSKALFESVSVAVAQAIADNGPDAASRLAARRRRIRSAFIALMSDRAFDRAISQGTGDPQRIQERFGKVRRMMQSALDD